MSQKENQITKKNKRMQQRIIYAVLFIVFFLIEVFIALYVHDDWIRPYAGDILVVVVLYCFIRCCFPSGMKLLPFYIFLFAAGVEFLQYFNLLKLLGLEQNRFFRIVLGSVFDVKDILCYAVGCILIVAAENLGKQVRK